MVGTILNLAKVNIVPCMFTAALSLDSLAYIESMVAFKEVGGISPP